MALCMALHVLRFLAAVPLTSLRHRTVYGTGHLYLSQVTVRTVRRRARDLIMRPTPSSDIRVWLIHCEGKYSGDVDIIITSIHEHYERGCSALFLFSTDLCMHTLSFGSEIASPSLHFGVPNLGQTIIKKRL